MKPTLRLLSKELAVCKLNSVPLDIMADDIAFLAKTPDEITAVCAAKRIPEDCIAAERGFVPFVIIGKLDFSEVGIIADISGVLADAGISVFTLSTYDTDYILVKSKSAQDAISALVGSGYSVVQ